MSDTAYLIAVVAVAASITWSLRAAPFVLLVPLRHSSLLPYLAERMPVVIMAILTVYSLRHVDVGSVVPAAAGIVVTTVLHLWRGNLVASLVGGTAVYVALVSTVFRP